MASSHRFMRWTTPTLIVWSWDVAVFVKKCHPVVFPKQSTSKFIRRTFRLRLTIVSPVLADERGPVRLKIIVRRLINEQ